MAVREFLCDLVPAEVHHGDCVGADAQFDSFAKWLGTRRVAHPPENDTFRAFCESDIILEPLSYHARNAEIVRCSEVILAAPLSISRREGGTWWTIHFAEVMGKPCFVVTPTGEVVDIKNLKR